jgi:AAA lid domain
MHRYELHHGVRISDSALVEAAELSNRYIADRFLPDKAIDIIDESAAKLKMEITSKPLALDEIDRKVSSFPASLEMARWAPFGGLCDSFGLLPGVWRHRQACRHKLCRCCSWRWSASPYQRAQTRTGQQRRGSRALISSSKS